MAKICLNILLWLPLIVIRSMLTLLVCLVVAQESPLIDSMISLLVINSIFLVLESLYIVLLIDKNVFSLNDTN